MLKTTGLWVQTPEELTSIQFLEMRLLPAMFQSLLFSMLQEEGGCALASGESFFQVIPAAYLHDITPYEAK